ncbi:MAG TPA: prepilin-type N-terminal cleavage/methylation domain-containing protein [Candidatus Didemnitutus sp.]|nr:prepilin-type N-terminal cleavage/methylation domain-containing protein [Candidatus Didemnitutus sp.]
MSFALTTLVCGVRASGRDVVGFSLLEMLMVIALIAALCIAYLNGFGGGQAAALQSAQAILAELILEARGKALATGHETRLLLNCGSAGNPTPARFLRCLVVQEQVDDGSWKSAATVTLPRGTVILPPNGVVSATLLVGKDPWVDTNGQALESTALLPVAGTGLVPAFPDELWCGLTFDPEGSVVSAGGNIIVASCRPEPGDSSCPLRCASARGVRGVLVSRYGIPVSLNGWGEI